MCAISAVGEQWRDGFPQRWPQFVPYTAPKIEPYERIPDEISREDFDALKEEVSALKELLRAAKIYDEATGQPDCEMDEKVELIRRVAELVGVDVDEVFGK